MILPVVEAPRHFAQAYISDMGRPFPHLLGTVGMLLTMLLWLSLLNRSIRPRPTISQTVSPDHNTNTRLSWVQRRNLVVVGRQSRPDCYVVFGAVGWSRTSGSARYWASVSLLGTPSTVLRLRKHL